MCEKFLVINGGSSSLKFSLYEMPSEKLITNGNIEKIGFQDSFWNIYYGDKVISGSNYLKSHSDAVSVMVAELIRNKIINDLDEINGIGHRVLHGGEIYNDSVLIDDIVLKNIINMTNLGPLHHPGEIAGIRAMQMCMPNVKQVAVFDTAFHQTMPKENYVYAVPYYWYTDYKVRRYGFHGTSHKYITEKMQEILNKKDVNLIICHIGSGASVCCVKDGKSFDTSMGLSPLDGLVMGTRSGEIDPSIIKFMVDESGRGLNDIMNELNKKSGLMGVCGKNDFRDVVLLMNSNDEQAKLAYDLFRDSIVKHISEYYFELLGEVDAVVFTAGILENNPNLREDIINYVSKPMSVSINKEVNDNIGYGRSEKMGIITSLDSKIPFYVIPTNEEIMIARDSYRIIRSI